MKNVNTVGELKEILSQYDDNDIVVMETIDLESGDVEDLFPFYVDEIDGVKLMNGETVREIRICQMSNVKS